ncbi:MAG: MBL fold metallo-hydrolase [Gammaproteobacteria bacterium]|nr:MBL fold metallo-hydrolase [Gammaproteobacteria bacterium]
MSDHDTPFSIHSRELGSMENFIYLVRDHATGRAAVVDPAWDVPAILEMARQADARITDVLLTHSHPDHINGVEALVDRTDAQVHLLKKEADFWGGCPVTPTLHHGGDVVEVGATPIELWHTPGHTPGSACLHLPGHLIAGDTLFVFGCGRCDLRGGDPEQMYDTLRRISESLPDETVVHPGHNYAVKPTSTLAEQREGNPFMLFDNRDDFVHYRMHEHDRVRQSPYAAVDRDALPRAGD